MQNSLRALSAEVAVEYEGCSPLQPVRASDLMVISVVFINPVPSWGGIRRLSKSYDSPSIVPVARLSRVGTENCGREYGPWNNRLAGPESAGVM